MQLRLGIIARATTDLDLLFRGRAADWLEPFDAALLSGSWNGFEARRKNDPVEIAVEEVTYPPIRHGNGRTRIDNRDIVPQRTRCTNGNDWPPNSGAIREPRLV
jgi:hypothetical protein